MKVLTKKDKIRIANSYKIMCKTQLCCKESEKVGKTRRGRKKHKDIMFPYPKRGKHNVVDGRTVPIER